MQMPSPACPCRARVLQWAALNALGAAELGESRAMLKRKPVFPHVIEMNVQAGQRLGCNVYLIFDEAEWLLIDVGYDETVDEIIELIRQLDFPLQHCKMVIATHADVDHIQGLAKINAL